MTDDSIATTHSERQEHKRMLKSKDIAISSCVVGKEEKDICCFAISFLPADAMPKFGTKNSRNLCFAFCLLFLVAFFQFSTCPNNHTHLIFHH
jgi:hypothetical protein